MGWQWIVREVFCDILVGLLRKHFGNDRSRRRARFRQIFIQIRGTLAIFRQSEIFTKRPIVALVPMWLEFGGGTPSALAHPLSQPKFLLGIIITYTVFRAGYSLRSRQDVP